MARTLTRNFINDGGVLGVMLACVTVVVVLVVV